MDHKIRLYESALKDIKYVYGAPVPFSTDPNAVVMREDDKAKMIANKRS